MAQSAVYGRGGSAFVPAHEGKLDKVIVYKRTDAKAKEIGCMTVHKSKGLQADSVT